MTIKRLFVILVLVSFSALTIFAAVSEPLSSIAEAITANWWSVQVTFDFLIALMFGTVLMARDAKDHGINPTPYIVAVVLTGSIGLLAYAVRRLGVTRPSGRLATRAA